MLVCDGDDGRLSYTDVSMNPTFRILSIYFPHFETLLFSIGKCLSFTEGKSCKRIKYGFNECHEL